MDPESAAGAGVVGALVIALRVVERAMDKRNGNGHSNNGNGLSTKVAVTEEKLEALSDKVEEVSEKTREALRNSYEILRRMDINEAIEKDRRSRHDARQDQRPEIE